ncbi:methyl-accepting chemotaxis protein [Desulfovibrio desulfuricans]|uniref:methyl-accepting chemotaxis protein n=1 Tax=Desulfovibrio desulfuricans TaxID=876 RepID=UPI0035B141BA
MRLSTKLIMSFAGMIIVIVAISAASMFSTSRMNESIDDVDKAYIPAVIEVGNMHLNFWEVRTNLTAMLLKRNESAAETYGSRIKESLEEIADGQKKYLKYTELFDRDTAVKAKNLLRQIDEISASMGTVRKNATKLVAEGKFDEATALFDASYSPQFRKLAPVYKELVDLTTASSRENMQEAITLGAMAKNTGLILSLVAIVISVVITYLLTRSVMRQLGKDPGVLNTIARRVVDGDYDIADGSSRAGVYGSIVSMVESLKINMEKAQAESVKAHDQAIKATEAMRNAEKAESNAQAKTSAMLTAAAQLEEVAHAVSSASTQLSAQIEQADSGALQTAQRLGEAATAMNEMNATVQEVAKNAGAASSASAETKAKAEHGATIVGSSLQSIQLVHQLSMELKDDMAQLDSHAQDVSQIMTVISDIADQTNLLALNAAIEAARAGEAGRGFAVVADEVRKLAEKTMASTIDVGRVIRAIQESTSKSRVSMDNAVEQVNTATESASLSGQALSEIVVTAEATADQANAIATASEEQSAASEEINHTIIEVNDMSRQTAEGMAEAAKAVSDLAVQAGKLATLIAEMRNG